MIKNNFYFLFFYEKYILFFILYNKQLKILTNQNIRATTKFLSYLIKNIKHFNKKKKLKPGKVTYP